MDELNLLLAAAVIIAGSMLQRVSGVGGGFLMVPLLAMIDVAYLPGPLVFATLALSSLMAWRDRAHVDLGNMPVILLGFIPGTLLGAWVLSAVPPEQLGVVFGAAVDDADTGFVLTADEVARQMARVGNVDRVPTGTCIS